jgi:hypothetical protein
MRGFILLVACLAMQGCLTTTKPAFDETNSIPAGDSPAMVAFVEAWEREVSKEDSPRELIENASLVHDMDGLVIVQEERGGKADYYAVGVIARRPLLCLVHDEKMDVIAERHGVELKVDRDEGSEESLPAPMTADGTKEALYAFVLDAFRNGLLACQIPSELTGGP